jgi:hypothetical protein
MVALQIRLGFGMSLALGLEFLLAADILRTAVAPTWEEIGQLAAIAAIRTGLNFFLGREFTEGERQIQALAAANLDRRFTGPPRTVPMRSSRQTTTGGAAADQQPETVPPTRAKRRHGLLGALRSAIAGPLFSQPPDAPPPSSDA